MGVGYWLAMVVTGFLITVVFEPGVEPLEDTEGKKASVRERLSATLAQPRRIFQILSFGLMVSLWVTLGLLVLFGGTVALSGAPTTEWRSFFTFVPSTLFLAAASTLLCVWCNKADNQEALSSEESR